MEQNLNSLQFSSIDYKKEGWIYDDKRWHCYYEHTVKVKHDGK